MHCNGGEHTGIVRRMLHDLIEARYPDIQRTSLSNENMTLLYFSSEMALTPILEALHQLCGELEAQNLSAEAMKHYREKHTQWSALEADYRKQIRPLSEQLAEQLGIKDTLSR